MNRLYISAVVTLIKEHSLCKGKYHCMADLLFDWFGFSSFAYVELDTDVQDWSNPRGQQCSNTSFYKVSVLWSESRLLKYTVDSLTKMMFLCLDSSEFNNLRWSVYSPSPYKVSACPLLWDYYCSADARADSMKRKTPKTHSASSNRNNLALVTAHLLGTY